MHKDIETWENIIKTAKTRQRQVQKQVCALCDWAPQGSVSPEQTCKTCRLLGQIDDLATAMYIAGYVTCMRDEMEMHPPARKDRVC